MSRPDRPPALPSSSPLERMPNNELLREVRGALTIRYTSKRDLERALGKLPQYVSELAHRLERAERYADGLHFAGRLDDERVVRAAISPPDEGQRR